MLAHAILKLDVIAGLLALNTPWTLVPMLPLRPEPSVSASDLERGAGERRRVLQTSPILIAHLSVNLAHSEVMPEALMMGAHRAMSTTTIVP
jgi:hypothetical protein